MLVGVPVVLVAAMRVVCGLAVTMVVGGHGGGRLVAVVMLVVAVVVAVSLAVLGGAVLLDVVRLWKRTTRVLR